MGPKSRMSRRPPVAVPLKSAARPSSKAAALWTRKAAQKERASRIEPPFVRAMDKREKHLGSL